MGPHQKHRSMPDVFEEPDNFQADDAAFPEERTSSPRPVWSSERSAAGSDFSCCSPGGRTMSPRKGLKGLRDKLAMRKKDMGKSGVIESSRSGGGDAAGCTSPFSSDTASTSVSPEWTVPRSCDSTVAVLDCGRASAGG